MITAALYHVLLPPGQTVYTVAPIKHTPSFHHYPNKIAVPLVLASPEVGISTPYCWMLQPSCDSASKGTLSSSPTIKERQQSRLLCGPGGCATTLSSNTLVFAVQMITAALCHVLLPLVQMTVCTVAPIGHAPSFYHYPNNIAVPLVLASPEERISTPYYWMLKPSWDSVSKGTLSSSPTIEEQRPSRLFCGLIGCAATLSSNTLVFAVRMITAALCHVLLPFVQIVCTVAPMGHAPSFYHYPNNVAVPLVLA
ncbi:hypothetical protein MRX96_034024 [Rhipicephalus microplus]